MAISPWWKPRSGGGADEAPQTAHGERTRHGRLDRVARMAGAARVSRGGGTGRRCGVGSGRARLGVLRRVRSQRPGRRRVDLGGHHGGRGAALRAVRGHAPPRRFDPALAAQCGYTALADTGAPIPQQLDRRRPAAHVPRGRPVGRRHASLELRRGRTVRTARRALPGAVPVGALPLRLAVGGRPRIGQMLEALVLDPLDGSATRRQYVIADSSVMFVPDSARYDSARGRWTVAHGTDVVAWRLDEVESASPTRIWVDAQGFVVRAALPSGFWLQRTAFEIAQLNLRAGKGASARYNQDYMTQSTRLTPVTPADTAADLLVPSDAATVRAAAEEAAAGALGAEATARALLKWTSREIAETPSDPSPDALAALAARRGGDAARSLLFVALARARGIPARIASGARRDGTGWTTRVWSEVHAGGWVAVDPATGDWPADTSLVRLRSGGTGHPLELAGLLARLTPSTAAP